MSRGAIVNKVVRYFHSRVATRIAKTSAVFGSCHYFVKPRSKWNPLRFILGPLKYTFVHPMAIQCNCNWAGRPFADAKKQLGGRI